MLSDQHREYLAKRGVTDEEIITRRGYETIEEGLKIPIYILPDGLESGYEIRLDSPKPGQRKFTRPLGTINRLNVQSANLSILRNESEPLYIVEGATRADALAQRDIAAIAINGCYGWRGKDEGQTAPKSLSDWGDLPIRNRDVIIGFDGDVTTKYQVNAAAHELGKFLERKGAGSISFIVLPDPEQGLDDFLAAGNSVRSLARHEVPFLELPKLKRSSPTKSDTFAGLGITDQALAAQVAEDEHSKVRFILDEDRWAIYSGVSWVTYQNNAMARGVVSSFLLKRSKALVAEAMLRDEPKLANAIATDLESNGRTNAVTSMLQTLSAAQIESKAFNLNPGMITCQNGVLNLVTGELHPHNPSLLLRGALTCDFNPNAKAPRWEKFLEEVMPDPDVRDWLQKFFGHSLLGNNKLRVLPVFIGAGANGKSVMLRAIGEVLGTDFQAEADKSILISSRMESHPTKLMALKGKRLVTASETETGDKFAAASLKQLTGGDEISARGMRQDQQTFKPSHSLILLTNALPEVDATDKAVWDRLKVIRFEQDFSRTGDPNLPTKLASEREGILAWLVRGLLKFHQLGLEDCHNIVMDTGEWQMEANSMAQFLEDKVIKDPKGTIPGHEMQMKYNQYCIENGLVPMASQHYTKAASAWGLTKRKTRKGQHWMGGILEEKVTPVTPPLLSESPANTSEGSYSQTELNPKGVSRPSPLSNFSSQDSTAFLFDEDELE